MQQPIRWPAEAIWEAVAPLLPGFTVEVLPSIDSTNTELMRRARAGQCEPTLLVAEQQTAGRGRLGRVWQSDVGASLMMSLGLPLAPADWSGLSLAVGVSVAESLQPLPPPQEVEQPARVGLKWPNDLWLGGAAGDRKLGGILVETASFVTPQAAAAARPASARYVVVGIGIFCLVMTYFSILYVWATRFQTTAATDIPISFIYAAMPVGFLLMFVHLLFVVRGYIADGSYVESGEMDAESAASL